MATDEAGGGVPGGELRERLSKVLKAGGWGISFSSPEIADAILAEMEAAGFAMVPVERLRWLEKAVDTCPGHFDCIGYHLRDPEPGDLDRPGGRE
jgi:hypothetical protein